MFEMRLGVMQLRIALFFLSNMSAMFTQPGCISCHLMNKLPSFILGKYSQTDKQRVSLHRKHLEGFSRATITRMHSDKMRAARSLAISHRLRLGGGVCSIPLWMQTPLDAEAPLQADPSRQTPQADPLERSPFADPPRQTPWMQTPIGRPHCGQKEWHTLVKTLPSRNYCCGR